MVTQMAGRVEVILNAHFAVVFFTCLEYFSKELCNYNATSRQHFMCTDIDQDND